MSELNEDQQQQIKEWLEEKSIRGACRVCGEQVWTVSDRLVEAREYHGGDLVIGGGAGSAPFFITVCNNCGNTRFFNALTAGIIKPSEGADDEEDVNNQTPREEDTPEE